ncbi:MAG: hypothetical protein J2P58_10280 [Acidimicrobiaceae bacterium]|nr:hypothetical protein [Acidimicrobiaceae bacterium]
MSPFIVDPSTGEKVPIGLAVWSKTRFWNDSSYNQTPVGGHVIDGDQLGEAWCWRVVEPHRGRVIYHWLRAEECDADPGRGVNKAAIRSLARLMHQEAARGGPDHLTALLALTRAVDL